MIHSFGTIFSGVEYFKIEIFYKYENLTDIRDNI